MDLTTISLEDFLCSKTAEDLPIGGNAFANIEFELMSRVGKMVHQLRSGYAIHEMKGQSTDMILLHDNKPVGCYWGDLLAIHDNHKGKGLSVPLILAAVVRRSMPETRKLTKAGRKALEKAWRVANGHESNPWL